LLYFYISIKVHQTYSPFLTPSIHPQTSQWHSTPRKTCFAILSFIFKCIFTEKLVFHTNEYKDKDSYAFLEKEHILWLLCF
jgi:hypothetical protein